MKLKNKLNEYTEKEFLKLVERILDPNAGTEEEDQKLIYHFNKITEHPAGSDLIFYPENEEDVTPEKITEIIKKWRQENRKPGFKKG